MCEIARLCACLSVFICKRSLFDVVFGEHERDRYSVFCSGKALELYLCGI